MRWVATQEAHKPSPLQRETLNDIFRLETHPGGSADRCLIRVELLSLAHEVSALSGHPPDSLTEVMKQLTKAAV